MAQEVNAEIHSLSKFQAWRNVLAITLLNCVVLGVGCFVVLGNYLRPRMELFEAAVWQQLGFAVGLAWS
jgi:hypothetical protein